ncbi:MULTISPECIES: MobP2 family relaxase [unclassified Sporolactobacillus]|uniref:MobP2 family relaxase n=1 Tax=unclassified Sporolactobacillus TaxID=2628533 RepID=UPI002367F441|nr:MobP2 family relaxase [Sporolactobacillus sp. CQH2019]MDD9150464.1 MobP2 family relaxase [Sporolactobacillus sp. CQH2019]
MTRPGIVLVSKFVQAGSAKFKNYVDYVDRSEAVRNDHFKQFNALSYDGYNNYMGNPIKSEGIFTAEKDALNFKEKQAIKKLFETAQENGSCMWQDVISFDNAWLAANGFYNPQTGWLNKGALQRSIRSGMRAMMHAEGLEVSAIWTASIHYNTGNIHVHVAMVEPQPTRAKQVFKDKETGEMYEARRGSRKKSTLDKMKSTVANALLNRDRELSRISELIHQRLAPSKVALNFAYDRESLQLFNQIYAQLPSDMRLWKYNNNAMNSIRPLIDEATKNYLEHEHPEEMKQLDEALKSEMNYRKSLYGDGPKETERYKDYYDNKQHELYGKLGNALLHEMKNIRKEERARKNEEWQQRVKNGGYASGSSYSSPRSISRRDLRRLRRALDNELQSKKNRRKYEEMQWEMEQHR